MRIRTPIILALGLVFPASLAHPDTLAEVMSRQDMEQFLTELPADQHITSYAIYQDRETFLLAYYDHHPDDPNLLDETLRLILIEPALDTVTRKDVLVRNMMESHGLSYLGSILEIQKVGGHYFLKGHLSPSASPTLVLTADLDFYDLIPGWIVDINEGGQIFYRHNEAHFGPRQQTRDSWYDPHTKSAVCLAE